MIRSITRRYYYCYNTRILRFLRSKRAAAHRSTNESTTIYRLFEATQSRILCAIFVVARSWPDACCWANGGSASMQSLGGGNTGGYTAECGGRAGEESPLVRRDDGRTRHVDALRCHIAAPDCRVMFYPVCTISAQASSPPLPSFPPPHHQPRQDGSRLCFFRLPAGVQTNIGHHRGSVPARR